jgi:multidrug resistance protein MdtO
MWFFFDRLWGSSAVVEMKRNFIANLRLLAQFAREPLSPEFRVAGARALSLRETINSSLDQVRAVADVVLFEFGSSREQGLALRRRIVRWQPQLRMIFLTRIALFRYRIVPGFELPTPVARAQQDFDENLARALDRIADRMEEKPSVANHDLENSLVHLDQTIQACASGKPPDPRLPRCETVLSLSRRIENLTISLDREITLS